VTLKKHGSWCLTLLVVKVIFAVIPHSSTGSENAAKMSGSWVWNGEHISWLEIARNKELSNKIPIPESTLLH
jgi:hypothetical protein